MKNYLLYTEEETPMAKFLWSRVLPVAANKSLFPYRVFQLHFWRAATQLYAHTTFQDIDHKNYYYLIVMKF